jgi:hypothetical protein
LVLVSDPIDTKRTLLFCIDPIGAELKKTDRNLPIDQRVQHIYVLLSRSIVSANKTKQKVGASIARHRRLDPLAPGRRPSGVGRRSSPPSAPALHSAVCLVGRAICIATLWSPIATRLTKTQVALLVLDQTSLL